MSNTLAPESSFLIAEDSRVFPWRSSKMHLAFVDGIRAMAALFVVLAHAYFEPTDGYYAEKWINHIGLSYGHLAVDVFIVVSGFCLMLSVARRNDEFGSFVPYILRRARRILPPYYAALGVAILFILAAAHTYTGTVWDNSLPLTWHTVVTHFLLVNDMPLRGSGGGINYCLWSIAVEFQLYFTLPLIAYWIVKLGNRVALTLAVVCGLAVHILLPQFNSATPWYFGLFAFGAVAARETVLGRVSQAYRTAAYALGIVLAIGIVVAGKKFFDVNEAYFDTLAGGAAALLMAATAQDLDVKRFALTRFLTWKPLVSMGAFSYSLYLVHAPLLHAINLTVHRFASPSPVTNFGLLIVCIPGIVAIAYLFHLVFEKPFMSASKVRQS
ncbi:MAG: acyltransferase [Capsulimonadaceae bacterium]|nr:acyltransferase [Capsulimonadaceae bacterium]